MYLTKNEVGRLTVDVKVAETLSSLEQTKAEIDDKISEIRKGILEEMIANNITKCSSAHYSFIQVQPKPITHFDNDKFMQNENIDIVNFVSTVTEEEPVFDIEKFKAEHKDLYDAYTKVDMKVDVDQKKLKESFPQIFEKYYSEEPSPKPATLRVAKAKE